VRVPFDLDSCTQLAQAFTRLDSWMKIERHRETLP